MQESAKINLARSRFVNFRNRALLSAWWGLSPQSIVPGLSQRPLGTGSRAKMMSSRTASAPARINGRCDLIHAEPDTVFALTVVELKRIIRDEVQRALLETSHTEPKNESKPYLSVKEAAEATGLAISTIRLYIRKGQLKALKIGRRVVVALTELERFMNLNPTGVVVY